MIPCQYKHSEACLQALEKAFKIFEIGRMPSNEFPDNLFTLQIISPYSEWTLQDLCQLHGAFSKLDEYLVFPLSQPTTCGLLFGARQE